ncbi:MAG TPA: AMP-binding protein [Croceibacterium sp.]
MERLTQSYWPAAPGGSDEMLTIGDLLRTRAARWPEAPALQEIREDGERGRGWTYARLLADAERLGRALASRHAPGARVAIFANNVPEWVLFHFGAALAGLIVATINPASQKRELRYMLERSRSEAVYCVEDFRGNPLRAIAEEVAAELPGVRHVIDLTDHAALFEGRDRGTLPPVRPEDFAQIQFTSGTTGFPKGALLRHHSLVRNAADFIARLGLTAGDRFILLMPLFHTAGCGISCLGAIAPGGEIVLPPLFEPQAVARAIERERTGFTFAVPTMIHALLAEAAQAGRDLTCLERIASGGAMVPPDLIARAAKAFGAIVQIGYGQTESSPAISFACHDDPLAERTSTVGRPVPGVEVAIRDPHDGAILPIGAQGEICTRGYHVMAAYDGNEEATAAAIDADGWLHTGDLGRMDERGFVSITGRVKEMIIRGGENLFPAEIENAILEHEAIGEAAVVGVPCPEFGEQVACFMRSSNGRQPGPTELKAFIRERLSPQKTPKYWLWVEQWPLTGSGKIQKFKLAEQFVAGEHLPV